MKKKIAIMLAMVTTAVSLTACGGAKLLLDKAAQGKEESEEVNAEVSEGDEGTVSENEPARSLGARFGTEFDENELGYEYLYPEILMTDSKENAETGKMESQKLQIVIPQGDYNTVNRDYAYGEKLGVKVHVQLNPYLQHHYEDYTLKENLQAYLDGEYDEFYSVDYKDVSISEITGDEEQVKADVDYFRYDKYDDDYTYYQVTYQLFDFGGDKLALVTTTICADDTTGKTPMLIAEVNDFYGTDIQWDADAAEARKQAFLNSNNGDVLEISTGWIKFELPKGWSEDWKNNDDYSRDLYAPDGDMLKAGCYIAVGRNYQEYGSEIDIASIAGREQDLAALKSGLATATGLDESDITIQDYGMTVLGQAIEFSYTVVEEGISYEEHRWWVSDKNYIYEITAGQIDGSKEDAIALAEKILAEGQVKGSDT